MRAGNEEACPKLTNFINVLQPRQQKAVWTALAELLGDWQLQGMASLRTLYLPSCFFD